MNDRRTPMNQISNVVLRRLNWLATITIFLVPHAALAGDPSREELAKNNAVMFEHLKSAGGLDDSEVNKIKEIFSRTGYSGQGNPRISKHPMTPEECHANAKAKGANFENPGHEKICGAKYMAPIYDPKAKSEGDARICIDKFEFPNIPCEYPVVWIKADEAASVCAAMGKRICDAHEWEGACEGELREPDYDFALVKTMKPEDALRKMRFAHNAKEGKAPKWSYGNKYQTGVCAANSIKSEGCSGEGWNKCGSNTYPSGSFPGCKSSLGVYDINGNAAEHMNIPLKKSEMASAKGSALGYTEMKGSWFIFDKYKAHEDYCRWRAPFWHGTRVMDPKSHQNYHLGFRCCKDIKKD
jgi:formylglycine-generating enzyme required for sulfatase activity